MHTLEEIKSILRNRIMLLDGAMGTMIQKSGTEEADFNYQGIPAPGNNDLLNLSRPELIGSIHTVMLEAGADIIETNTFNSTTVAQTEYRMQDLSYELSLAGAGIARKAADNYMKRQEGSVKFVAGILGPTNRTLSMSPDVNNPAAP